MTVNHNQPEDQKLRSLIVELADLALLGNKKYTSLLAKYLNRKRGTCQAYPWYMEDIIEDLCRKYGVDYMTGQEAKPKRSFFSTDDESENGEEASAT